MYNSNKFLSWALRLLDFFCSELCFATIRNTTNEQTNNQYNRVSVEVLLQQDFYG